MLAINGKNKSQNNVEGLAPPDQVPFCVDEIARLLGGVGREYEYIHCVQKKTPTHIFFHISISDA